MQPTEFNMIFLAIPHILDDWKARPSLIPTKWVANLSGVDFSRRDGVAKEQLHFAHQFMLRSTVKVIPPQPIALHGLYKIMLTD